jgi:RNA polymerase sigma-70 factor, ECF subfamily
VRNVSPPIASNPVAEGPADADLVADARTGDHAAFERLVRRYQDRVFNLAYRMTGAMDEAEDAAQEVFFKAHRALGQYRGGAGFYTWLYRITVNTCRSRGRQTVRARAVEGISLDGRTDGDGRAWETASKDPTPDVEAMARERSSEVQTALAELADDLRAVVLLRDLEGMSYAEIADLLSLTSAAVRSRLHRARLTLARRLRDLPPP